MDLLCCYIDLDTSITVYHSGLKPLRTDTKLHSLSPVLFLLDLRTPGACAWEWDFKSLQQNRKTFYDLKIMVVLIKSSSFITHPVTVNVMSISHAIHYPPDRSILPFHMFPLLVSSVICPFPPPGNLGLCVLHRLAELLDHFVVERTFGVGGEVLLYRH